MKNRTVIMTFNGSKEPNEVYKLYIKDLYDALHMARSMKELESLRQEAIKFRDAVDALIEHKWEEEQYGNHIRRELPWPEHTSEIN